MADNFSRLWCAQKEKETDLVATPHKWTAGNVKEAHILSHLLPPVELSRLDISVNLHMSLCRSHVLAEGHDVHVNFSQFYKSQSYDR